MVTRTTFHQGNVAARTLEIVCKNAADAYRNGILRILRQRYGQKYTHQLEVGKALQWLVEEGLIQGLPITGKGPHAKLMYVPTMKAGFHFTLNQQS